MPIEMAMGKSETTVKPQSKSRKKEKDILPTKVVMRRLPASFTEEELRGLLVDAPEFDFFRFVPADQSLVQHAFSRAYINFKRFEDVTAFRNTFDGYIFKAGKGDESSAVVEVAPFQGIPKEGRKRKDPKCGIITKDSDYEAFLEELNKKVEPFPSAEVYVEEMEQNKSAGAAEKVQTPLTEFLNKKKAAKIYSRQSAVILENERKAKREKETRDSSKSTKGDEAQGKSSRTDKSDYNKGSQDKRNSESKRKEERRDRRSGPSKKNKSERENKDQKKVEAEDERPLSARSDGPRRSEGRINKREERRHPNDRRSYDERRNRDEKRDERDHRKTYEQKKSSRAEPTKEGEQPVRRKSIEFEDPSIVAFGKSVDGGSKKQVKDVAKGREGEKSEQQKDGEGERGKHIEGLKSEKPMDEADRKKRNRERPEMAVYRPPVARQDRGKGKDERTGGDKSRVKSPPGTKSPDKKDRSYERPYRKDRPRSGQKDSERDYGEKERERMREKERRNREQDRRDKDREREKKKEKEKMKESSSR